MPKYTKKNRLLHKRTTKSGTEDSASIDDGVSTASNVSDVTSIYDDVETEFSTPTELVFSTDSIDDKLDTCMDNLHNKDSKTRENALRILQTLFCQKLIVDPVSERSEGLIEQLTNSLKKGSETEGSLAATVTSLLILQLGEPNDELYKRFHDVILPVMRDDSKSPSLRAKYAQTIGILCFLLSEDISSTVELMTILETIFSGSYLRADHTSPIVNTDIHELHTAALSSWCLLLSTMPNNHAHDLIRIYAPEKIPGLIESNDANLRNQAGEAIAVLYEIARDIHSIFAEPPESLLILLEKKAKESVKYKGKKEKRLQHATFREVYNSLEEGISPDFDVKFGRETLQITSWTMRLYYNIFSRLLAQGIIVHLKENAFLRSIFNMDEPEIADDQSKKEKRSERHLANKAAFKQRTQQLRKIRANKQSRQQQDQ